VAPFAPHAHRGSEGHGAAALVTRGCSASKGAHISRQTRRTTWAHRQSHQARRHRVATVTIAARLDRARIGGELFDGYYEKAMIGLPTAGHRAHAPSHHFERRRPRSGGAIRPTHGPRRSRLRASVPNDDCAKIEREYDTEGVRGHNTCIGMPSHKRGAPGCSPTRTRSRSLSPGVRHVDNESVKEDDDQPDRPART